MTIKVLQEKETICADCKVVVKVQRVEEKQGEDISTFIKISHPFPHCDLFEETKKEPRLFGGTAERGHGFTSPISDYLRACSEYMTKKLQKEGSMKEGGQTASIFPEKAES